MCDDFGGYIYLVTCKRVCFLCLCENETYLPYDLTARKFNTVLKMLDNLPHMRSLPGTYSPNEKKSRKRLRLYDRESVKHCGSGVVMEQIEQMEQNAFDGKSGNMIRFKAIVQAPALNPNTRETESGFHCIGCQKSYCQRPQHFRRRFSKASFALHLQECGPIRDGKHQDR